MSEADPQAAGSQTSPASGGSNANDPLASLHHMQTVAGAASQTYIAVNGLAVVTLLLGILSFTVFVLPILAVIPMATVVCATWSLLQIRHSNGTETGRKLAIAGLIAALLAGGGVAVSIVQVRLSIREDTQDAAALLETFGKQLHDSNYAAAYGNCADYFKNGCSVDRFRSVFSGMQQYNGPLQAIRWNGVDPAFYNNKTLVQLCGIFVFQKSEQRIDVACVKVQGKWQILQIGELFPAPRKSNAK